MTLISALRLAALGAVVALHAAPPARLDLKPHDHIALIGNSLADRMQHDGWFEALVHSRFPDHELVFRNLGFSGDEVTTRLRSEAFGTPDEWLRRTAADVVLAFFGFNESFQGEAGLATFRKDLEAFIRSTRGQDYSGKGAPRLVLVSPLAAERHPDPNFRDPVPINRNLALYTQAMAEVAAAQGVPFVDLFTATPGLYGRAGKPLTVNGIHLSDSGYEALAPVLFETLFGEPPPPAPHEPFERLREAVNDKNATWFRRYRTVDGYNVYGGRSHLEFDGVKNRDTMLREMEMREVMTANRDRRIWAVARGGNLAVQDDNLPPPVRVKTNKAGPNPDGSHKFLNGEEAIRHMKVATGCEVNLFASEEQFPDLANPVQMGFDARGRLWVAAWPNYPSRTPDSTKGDSLLVFEDTDGDGRADKVTPFVDDLNCPTGFQFYKDGVILVQAPDVWFVRDTDGDGRADWKERVLSGLDSADTHHTANALALDPGGAIYLSDGVFHRTQVETPWGPVRNNDGAIFRFEPRTARFERYIAYGFANPHGRVFDRWGNDLVTDATGNNTYFGPAISGRIDYPAQHPGIREFWARPSRPCPGTGMLSSRHFPDEFQGNFLNCNVIGFQGIFRAKVTENGSGLAGETLEHLVQSDDPNFRPSAVGVGPDGAVYFLDWHNPIIGHMQHHMRDPSRDHQHGRVYRLTAKNRPLLKPPPVAGQPIDALVALLDEPEDDVRLRVKIELGARDTVPVLAAVSRWAAQFEAGRIEHQHALLEALWVHQWHNVVNEPLLRQMLRSPEPRARAAAVRVLCYWRDRIEQPLALLRTAARDAAPRVRLEALRTASFFSGREALEVAYEAVAYETDYYLDYVYAETMRVLQPTVKEPVLPDNPKALGYVLGRLSNDQLLGAPALEPVLLARLERPGLDLNARNNALIELAAQRHSDRVREALALLKGWEARRSPATAATHDLGKLLVFSPASDLRRARPEIAELARTANLPAVQRATLAALVTADEQPNALWAMTASNPRARAALLSSIILVVDPALRATFQPLLIEVLAADTTPPEVRQAALEALPLMDAEQAPQSYAILLEHLRAGKERVTAARALRQLPRGVWTAETAGPAAEAILEWARTVAADRRTEREYVETVQAAQELAALLERAEATRISRALRDLAVPVFVLRTVREQMRYDTPRLVVEAGKPFEILFENVDMMAHNLVITQPGMREEIGRQAETMPPRPDKEGRLYVPDSPKIIAATRMLDPEQTLTLKLTAPANPGSYDYLCTYPEHWKVMFGELLVVKDAEALVQATAQPAPASTATAAAGPVHHH